MVEPAVSNFIVTTMVVVVEVVLQVMVVEVEVGLYFPNLSVSVLLGGV